MESRKSRCNSRLQSLRSELQSFIPHYRELSEHILPRQSRFLVSDTNKGDKRNDKIINNVATLAARTCSSGMVAGITSPARPWFNLTPSDPELMRYAPVKYWLNDVENRMRDVFSKSNLYNALPMVYSNLVVFGTAAMAVMEDFTDVIRCYVFPTGSYMISNSNRLIADTMYREYQLKVRQLVQEFGYDNCSESVRGMFDRGQYDQWIPIVHAIEENVERDLKKDNAKNKPYSSIYYEVGNGDLLLRESGFDEFPVMAPRWGAISEDDYATSCPGMDSLGDIKSLQFEEKRKAQAIDILVRPPMVGPSSLRTSRASSLPGDITFVDSIGTGKAFSPAYEINPRIDHLMNDIEKTEARIKRSFYEDLFLMLAESDRREITAREIDERHEEKLLMLGPTLERLHDELLDPLIDRTFNIMLRNGLLPIPPKEIQNQDIKVEYISIMAQAQKMIGTSSIVKTVGFVSQIATVNPDSLDNIDFDEAIGSYSNMVGIPPRIIRTPDAVQAIRDTRNQQNQALQMAQMADPIQQATKAAKNLSEADLQTPNALTSLLGVK